MLNLYFVYNGHCKFYLGSFNNVDELIERMKDISGLSQVLPDQDSKNISEKTMYVLIMAL